MSGSELFAAIPGGTPASFASPWNFNSGGPLWAAGGFTFILQSSSVSSQGETPGTNGYVVVLGTGVVSGNGYTATPMNWSFQCHDPFIGYWSFSASSVTQAISIEFSYTTNNGTITITSYTGSGGNVTIPGTINGYSVTAIGANAFSSKTSVTQLIIPNSVTNIGNYAFYYCSGITNLTIGNSVTSIGDDAFYNCYRLTNVTIPGNVTNLGNSAFEYCSGLTNALIGNSVVSIGSYVFYGCSGLTSVIIPGSVISIGSYAFRSCYQLTNIAVDPANPSYASAGGVLFNDSMTTLIQYPGGLAGIYVIPSSVTNIGDYAFEYCSGLTNVAIGSSVASIGADAFFGCSHLPSVTVPASVTNIGNYAFYGCSSLTNIAVDAANPSYASAGGVLFDKNMTSLIQCPGGRLSGAYAIPTSVTNLSNNAFAFCFGLTSVTIPASVISISYPFYSCPVLTNIVVDPANPLYASVGGVWFNRNITLLIQYPSGLVGSYAIPNSVTNIGNYAFDGCSGLTNVAIPNSVVSIGSWTFAYCSGLKSVTIPSSVTNIVALAFYSCSGLTNVTIGSSFYYIGDSAFANCTSLHQAYFQGNAPIFYGPPPNASTVFSGETGTAYYVPGTTGWGATFCGWPTAGWYQPRPQILGSGYGFGVQSNRF